MLRSLILRKLMVRPSRLRVKADRTRRAAAAAVERLEWRVCLTLIPEALEDRRLFAAYSLASLGSLAGYPDFTATGLNNIGQVVGYAGSDPYAGTARAFVSKAGTMSAVAGIGSTAAAINDAGTIVGQFMNHAFLKPQGGALTDLTAKMAAIWPSDFPYYGWATDINASGTVIGTIGQIDDPSAWQYAGGKFYGAPGMYAGKINDNGVIAGIYFDPANAFVLVTRGDTTFRIEPTDIGGINNLDQVVGYSYTDGQAYLYEPGGAVQTFGPGGAAPLDINNQGIMVGHFNDGLPAEDYRAFVIRNGVFTDLNTLVKPPAGVVLTDAVGINDKGQIAVNGLKAGKRVAFLLSPSGMAGSIAGRAFNDSNHNGVRNSGELGLSDWRVYVDANKNGVWNIGEQITQTNSAGDYKLTNLPAGTFRVNEVRKDGWTRTNPPGSGPMGYFEITLASRQVVTGKDFGNIMLPSLSVASVTAAEGDAGTTSLKFTVRLSAASADPVTVKYSTGDDTAKTPGDYARRFGTLTFAPGETAKTVSVAVKGDTAVEADERFKFVLYNPSGATIAKALAFGTIRNDDRYPAVNPGISVSDARTIEGDGGTHAVTFTVSLDRPTSKAVSVRYGTADGTAKISDNDYRAASGTLRFRPGERTRTVSVIIIGDPFPGGDEYFRLVLSSPVNGSLTRVVGIGTILTDDPPRVRVRAEDA